MVLHQAFCTFTAQLESPADVVVFRDGLPASLWKKKTKSLYVHITFTWITCIQSDLHMRNYAALTINCLCVNKSVTPFRWLTEIKYVTFQRLLYKICKLLILTNVGTGDETFLLKLFRLTSLPPWAAATSLKALKKPFHGEIQYI